MDFTEEVQLQRERPIDGRLDRLEERLRRDQRGGRDTFLAIFLSVRRDIEDGTVTVRPRSHGDPEAAVLHRRRTRGGEAE